MLRSTPWDLRRRGLQDSRRHDERVRQAVRDQLPRLITEETIITGDGKRRIRIPIRYLEQYRFRYANEEEEISGVGQGKGAKGDVIARQTGAGASPFDRPGDQPGKPVYEAEFSVEELSRMMLEQFALPWLRDTPDTREEVVTDTLREVRRHGLWNNIDKRRTLYENLKRQAARGRRRPGPFVQQDLRFRSWREERKEQTRAAVYMLMDRSGSMTTEKRYISKCFFFWLVQFLRLKYDRVELVFIAHDHEAYIVSEHDFFTISSSGGTRCSSAYECCLEHLREHHPANRWNNYVFHFSDGDNFPDDNPRARELVGELLEHASMVGFGEIHFSGQAAFFGDRARHATGQSPLFQTLSQIEHPRLVTVQLRHRADVYGALERFLGREVAGVGA